MKTTLKRTLSLVLTVCMLLSVLPFAASAQEFVWNPDVDNFSDSDQLTLKYVYASSSHIVSKDFYRVDFKSNTEKARVFGMRLLDVTAGKYTVTFNMAASTTVPSVKFYVVTQNDFAIGDYSASAVTDRNVAVYEMIDSGNFSAYESGTITDDTKTVSFTADMSKAPVILIEAASGGRQYFDFTSFSITAAPTVSEDPIAKINGNETANVQDVKTALEAENNTVQLLSDINLDGAVLNSSATLDLNGMTVSGDLVINGTVTDSVGGGVFADEPVVSDGKVALAKDGGYVVVKYALKNETAKDDGNGNTKYWLRVELDGTDVKIDDAYALASADANFKIYLEVRNDGVAANKVIGLDALIGAWAEDMTSNDDAGNVCFCVTITGGASYNLTLTPAVTRTAN